MIIKDSYPQTLIGIYCLNPLREFDWYDILMQEVIIEGETRIIPHHYISSDRPRVLIPSKIEDSYIYTEPFSKKEKIANMPGGKLWNIERQIKEALSINDNQNIKVEFNPLDNNNLSLTIIDKNNNHYQLIIDINSISADDCLIYNTVRIQETSKALIPYLEGHHYISLKALIFEGSLLSLIELQNNTSKQK